MRAVVIDGFGGREMLRVAEVPDPLPADDEVLIRIASAGVNPIDWKERSGVFAQGPRKRCYIFPFILGFDGAGVVEAVGRRVSGISPGQRVVTCSDGPGKWGTYAELVAVRLDRVAPMPASLDFRQAAAFPLAALTMWQDLFSPEKGALESGQTILIHGGAGGLGSYGIQIAKAFGLRVAATCRTANVRYIRDLGADLVIDYQTEEIQAALHNWQPAGIDVVIDAVGGRTLPNWSRMLRSGGRLIRVATLTNDDDVESDRTLAEHLGLHFVWAILNFDGVGSQLTRIAEMFDSGHLRSPPITVMPLAAAADAHAMIETQHLRGKLVLDVAGPDASRW